MQDERDIVVFTDDDGNDFELEVMDYFFYNGQEYAVLADGGDGEDDDAEDACGCGHDHAHEHAHGDDCACGSTQQDVYIMKVTQVGDDMEEFLPVEDSLMEELIAVVQQRFNDDDFDDEDYEDEEDDEEDDEEEDEE